MLPVKIIGNMYFFRKNILSSFEFIMRAHKTHTHTHTHNTNLKSSGRLLFEQSDGSNPGGCQIFRSRPGRPWGPPSLLFKGYWVSLPGVKRQERDVDHLTSSRAEVKEKVEL